jgi:exopolyphosphatase
MQVHSYTLYLIHKNPLSLVDHAGLRVDMKAFEIDKVTSRKTIERLLEEFGGASKG